MKNSPAVGHIVYGMWFESDHWIVCVDETADDEFIFRRSARKASVGSSISFFSKGLAAYDYLKSPSAAAKGPPSVIFVRYRLADCSGRYLVDNIRKLSGYENVPVVFLTSPADESDFFSGPAPKGNTFLYEKLVSPETFQEIEELLRHAAQDES